jgi:hypothetical protein
VGIVHPSKVYNIRRVGIPFFYIGPSLSPVADFGPMGSFRHGDAKGVADLILAASEGQPYLPDGRTQFIRTQHPLEHLIATIGG